MKRGFLKRSDAFAAEPTRTAVTSKAAPKMAKSEEQPSPQSNTSSKSAPELGNSTENRSPQVEKPEFDLYAAAAQFANLLIAPRKGADQKKSDPIPRRSFLDQLLDPPEYVPSLKLNPDPSSGWFKAGQPNQILRLCKDSFHDTKPSCCFMCYDDIVKSKPENYPLPPRTPSPAPYAIQSIKGKGLGMFASRDIAQGETIIIERASVICSEMTICSGGEEAARSFVHQFEKVVLTALPSSITDEIYKLANCKGTADGYGKLWAICHTNFIPICFPASEHLPHYGALFLHTSRINHDCSPNAVWATDHRTISVEVRALRPIRKGEEITGSYVHQTSATEAADRRAETLSKYGFRCQCTSCSYSWSEERESNFRRKRIAATAIHGRNLFKQWLSDRALPDNKLIDLFKSNLPLCEKEGLKADAGGHHIWIALAYAALGNEGAFKEWGVKAKSATRVCGASDEVGFFDETVWDQWIESPETCPMWNKRK